MRWTAFCAPLAALSRCSLGIRPRSRSTPPLDALRHSHTNEVKPSRCFTNEPLTGKCVVSALAEMRSHHAEVMYSEYRRFVISWSLRSAHVSAHTCDA
eukprot:890287-Prymnesium_polylepis.2